MAQCKDCIHYEICDEYVSPCESFPEVDGCKCFLNKADVVPKSEVDKLQNKLIVWKQDRFNLYQRLELYKMAQEKGAREIFEGVENIIDTNYNKHIFGDNDLDDLEHEAVINFSDDISSDLEELKKKYKVCDGNCQKCDQAIWDRSTSFVGDNRIIGCEWKESEDKP